MKTRIWYLFLTLAFILGPQVVRAAEKPTETTLTGYFIERSDNTYIHIEMIGVRMVFKLLDEDYREIENVFTRGVMTVNPRGKSSERMVIRPTGDGLSLEGVKTIKKPHLLKVFGRLYQGEDDTTGEAFNVLYNQHTLEEVVVKPLQEE